MSAHLCHSGETIGLAIRSPRTATSESDGANIRRKDVHFLILVKKPEIDRDFWTP